MYEPGERWTTIQAHQRSRWRVTPEGRRPGAVVCAVVMLISASCTPTLQRTSNNSTRHEGSEPQIAEMDRWTWSEIAPNPYPFRGPLTTTVWTGREMVIWGGDFTGTGVKNVHGASYDPALDRWSDVPPAPLVDRRGHDAIWTGSEMIIWGGTTAILPPSEIAWDGAAYDPQRKAWRRLPDPPIGPRYGPEVAWTGTEMLVVGGIVDMAGNSLSDGAAYNPATDQWRVLPPIPDPGQTDAYVKRTSVWSGDALLLWTRTVARTGFATPVTELMVLDPERGSWTKAPAVEGAPLNVLSPLWTGTGVMVQPVPPAEELGMCPGPDGGGASTEGGLYDPLGNVWRPIKPSRYYLSGPGVWTGEALVGTADLKSQFREPCDRDHGGPGSPRPGEPEPTLPVYEPPGPPERIWAAWSPSTQEWISLPDPGGRTVHFGDQMIWTGNEILTSRYRFGP